MGTAVVSIVILYWPLLLLVAAGCFLLLLYGACVEPKLVKMGVLQERFDAMSREDAVRFIDKFLNNSCGGYEIDDFISGNYRDPIVKELANYVAQIQLPISSWTAKQLRDFQDFKSRLATKEIEAS